MQDLAIIWDWCAFAVRWLHVITAMAWIGSSFYFIALDLGLRKAPDMPDGVHGMRGRCMVVGFIISVNIWSHRTKCLNI